jgi:hopanoid biosynthesis associated RND transporter like protein HpnN
LVVVDTKSPEQTTRALAYLGQQFRDEKQHVESVYIPGEGSYFDKNSLLYLELDDLRELAAKLTEAQPFIGTLSKDNSLTGLFSIIELALTTNDRELPVDLSFLLDKIDAAIRDALKGTNYQLSWQQLMFGADQDLLTTRRFIQIKPKLDYSKMVPAEESLKAVRTIVKNAGQVFPGVRIRLTGEVVLEQDEMESIERSAFVASLFSIILVCIALLIGLKSLKLTLVTLIVLLMGLILTAGFATLAIGHLNLISISFAVLYIGIGVDYAIQMCLRYRELLQEPLPQRQALTSAIRKVGPSITLCALTTSVGFFSFIPTAYTGVSELGIIAGTGMFIALIISLMVLPALLKLLSLDIRKATPSGYVFPDWVYRFPIERRVIIQWTAVVLTVAGLALLTQVRFDFNPLNLRDPNSESVATFKELLKTKDTSPMTLTVLAKDKTKALATAQKLKQLDSVENAITIFDFVPDNQNEKIAIIEDLSLLMGLHMTKFPPLHEDSIEINTLALKNLQKTIDKKLAEQPDSPLSKTLRQLREDLEQYLVKLESETSPVKKAMLEKLQSSLLDTLPDTMNSLFKGLQAGNVSIDALPEEISERWLNKDGIYRIMVFPSKDLNDLANMKEFIADVRQLAPHATDLPVIYLETGNAVVEAFLQALIGALLAITVVLLIIQRNLKETFLILMPLLMAAVLTGASTVLMNNPFNFANIIIIPLLFGLGANGGIYIIHRLRELSGKDESILRTSTARGVVFCNLTTLCSLVSMSFTPHLGLASMGQLLSIGLVLIMICTLVVLPAFAGRLRS